MFGEINSAFQLPAPGQDGDVRDPKRTLCVHSFPHRAAAGSGGDPEIPESLNPETQIHPQPLSFVSRITG